MPTTVNSHITVEVDVEFGVEGVMVEVVIGGIEVEAIGVDVEVVGWKCSNSAVCFKRLRSVASLLVTGIDICRSEHTVSPDECRLTHDQACSYIANQCR